MGTATAPAAATPRSATVHSTRVPARMETMSPLFTPTAISPHPVSSPSFASCAQVTSSQRPETLRRAAVRCPSIPARWRKSCVTDWMFASSLRCFCIALTWLSAVAMRNLLLRRVGRSVRLDPVASLLLQAPLLRGIVARRSIEDLLHQLGAFVDLVPVGITIGEVDLRPQVLRVGADGLGQYLRGLVDVALGPGKLEEIAAPDDLRRSIQVVLVDPERGEDPIAKFPLEPLGERRDDPDALGVEADSHRCVVVAADLAGVRTHGLLRGLPGLLSQGGLLVRLLRVRLPVVERGEAPVRLERAGVHGEDLLQGLLQLLFGAALVAVAPQLVELLAPAGRSFRGERRALRRRWRADWRRLREEEKRKKKHGRQRRTTAAHDRQPEAAGGAQENRGAPPPRPKPRTQGGYRVARPFRAALGRPAGRRACPPRAPPPPPVAPGPRPAVQAVRAPSPG